MLTYEQRLELLKKAREAKKLKASKKKEYEPEPEPEPEPQPEPEPEPEYETVKPKKTRSKSVAPKGRTLDIKEPSRMPDFIDSEPEVEEQIIYKPRNKKKKKLIKKIIMENSSDSDEPEVEIIEEHVKAPKKEKNKQPIVKPNNNPFFNF